MTKDTTHGKKKQRPRRGVLIPLVVAAAALAVTLVMVLTPSLRGSAVTGSAGVAGTAQPSAASDQSAADAVQSLEHLARRTPNDPMALGKVDAPVVMIAYSEFQCPFCGKFARDTEPTLIKKFVDNGTLRIEWRDFPYLGPESTTAAQAGRAAAAQGKFWAFHDTLYAHQTPVNSGKLTETYLTGIAKDLGMDATRFGQDLTSAQSAAAVQKDFTEGQSIGVTGTPAFLINGQPIIGAQPTATFVAAVEQAAATAR